MPACEGSPMRTIALVNQKGGCGKTTVALHLAAAFWRRGENVLVLDLDPQASAAEWHDARAEPLPHVESVQPARLAKVVDHAREIATGSDWRRYFGFGQTTLALLVALIAVATPLIRLVTPYFRTPGSNISVVLVDDVGDTVSVAARNDGRTSGIISGY